MRSFYSEEGGEGVKVLKFESQKISPTPPPTDKTSGEYFGVKCRFLTIFFCPTSQCFASHKKTFRPARLEILLTH